MWLLYRCQSQSGKLLSSLRLSAVSVLALPSWAGHDAQIFAASGVPTGMIFVPSINGVSHSKEESSDFQSVTQAVKVLEKTLKTLAEG